MNFIIDTHAVIWFITEDKELPQHVKSIIEDEENTCYVSIASLWEMGIKYALGRLELKPDLKMIFELIDKSGISILSITSAHVLMGTSLEFHHRDPFDRLIIAQAKHEGLKVISKDGVFKNYDINLIWK